MMSPADQLKYDTLDDALAQVVGMQAPAQRAHLDPRACGVLGDQDEDHPERACTSDAKVGRLCELHNAAALRSFPSHFMGALEESTRERDGVPASARLIRWVDDLRRIITWDQANCVDLSIGARDRRERADVLTDLRHKIARRISAFDRQWTDAEIGLEG